MVGKRLQTAGTYDFATIIRDGMVYADKTDLVYDLTHEYRLVFLSRPRRFGKSLLCSTLKYYFEGRKELFSGLKIDAMEQDWKEYPVLHFDMSAIKELSSVEQMKECLAYDVSHFYEKYGIEQKALPIGKQLEHLIRTIHEKYGLGVVIIIDEYDAPMLNHLNK
ncbi:MAG: AAA family ATPase, partial [Paludibacteraceae bacterium]|nr:AAA family ATPase [Paludibacteraceae bacterium]